MILLHARKPAFMIKENFRGTLLAASFSKIYQDNQDHFLNLSTFKHILNYTVCHDKSSKHINLFMWGFLVYKKRHSCSQQGVVPYIFTISIYVQYLSKFIISMNRYFSIFCDFFIIFFIFTTYMCLLVNKLLTLAL